MPAATKGNIGTGPFSTSYYRSVPRLLARKVSHSRWRFAQQHEREYQKEKALRIGGRTESLVRVARTNSASVSAYLCGLGLRVDEGLVVEVGSGVSGLIWHWPSRCRVAIDPLAHYYRQTYPKMQSDGPWIVQAQGERIPLSDACAELVLSDNVIDHVESPSAYLEECHRILKPGGVLYMTVDVHHPVYWWAGRFYNALFELGVRANAPAFPNHPFHFTLGRIEELIMHTDFKLMARGNPAIPKAGRLPFTDMFRHTEQYIKSVFYKNARCALVATT